MALPKYKEIKAIIEKNISRRFNNAVRIEMRPFNESPKMIQHEGKKLIHNTLDNQDKQREMPYQKAEVEYRLDRTKMTTMTPKEMFAIIDEKAKEMGAQIAKHQFQVLNKAIEETGNSVNAKDQKLSPELFLESMRKISISFDKDGNPEMPTMLVGEKMTEDCRLMLQEAEADPKYKAEFDKIIEEKKKEYDADQARRKLVD